MPEIESVYEAARIAECPRVPDGGDKEAVDFLQSCIDSGADLYKAAAREQFSEEGVNELVDEYADGCIPIYTNQLWWGWVELGGFRYHGDSRDIIEYHGAEGGEMERIPQADFYDWARRIISYRADAGEWF